jgi:glyoxylase-like metal-dependent hydrolase (beta-lactamase superfamily II)
MNRAALIFHLAILALSGLAGCGEPEMTGPGLVRVTGNVYAFIPESFDTKGGLGANSGFVVGEEGVLVVDSRFTPAHAEELLASIRKVTALPVRYLVNTHYHPEHTWGNSVFREKGAVILARPETAGDMKLYYPMYREYYRRHKPETFRMIEDIQPAIPDSIMGDSLEIDMGNVTVSLKYLGPGHTAGDCLVSVDGGRVVFAGGLVSVDCHPNLADRGSDYDNWLHILDRIGKLSPEYIVPAEGRICGTAYLENIKKYITGLRKLCRKLAAEGVGVSRAVSTVKAGDFMSRASRYCHENLLPFNVRAVYQRELVYVINPDFTIDMPDDFTVTGGRGDRKAGKLMWTRVSQKGYEEIEVQWQPTNRRQILIQDIYQKVSGFQGSSSQKRKYRIEGNKKILIQGEEVPAVHGMWLEDKEGVGAGGLFTVNMILANGKIYTIQCLESVIGGKGIEEKYIRGLEEIVSSFRVQGGEEG